MKYPAFSVAAVAMHNQGMLCVGSTTNHSLFNQIKEAADLRIKGLKTRLQALLGGKGEMTIDDDLVNHCFSTAVHYVKDREAANVDVLKLFNQ